MKKNVEKHMKKKIIKSRQTGKTKLNLECQRQIISKHKKSKKKNTKNRSGNKNLKTQIWKHVFKNKNLKTKI